jgi:hypothetical protein
MPFFGLELLDMAQGVTDFNLPARVGRPVAEMDADAQSMRRSAGVSAFRSAESRCSPRAHSTAPTTEPNSMKTPSPVVFTVRPPCWAISGSVALRCSRKASTVPTSSAPISRE